MQKNSIQLLRVRKGQSEVDSLISNYIKEVRDYTVWANEISLSPQLGVTRWGWQGMSH